MHESQFSLQYTQSELKDISTDVTEPNQCVICYEKDNGESISRCSGCHKAVHSYCYEQWLKVRGYFICVYCKNSFSSLSKISPHLTDPFLCYLLWDTVNPTTRGNSP